VEKSPVHENYGSIVKFLHFSVKNGLKTTEKIPCTRNLRFQGKKQ